MSLFNLHIDLQSDAEHAKIKALLAAAGHEGKSFVMTEADKLALTIKNEFPDVVAGIKRGITDFTDPTVKGVLKLEKVALDAVAVAPAVLAALPHLKDALIQVTSSLYNDTLGELEKAAGALIAKL